VPGEYIACVIVCGLEFSAETIRQIQETIAAEPGLSRSGLSRRVCQWLDWRSANGKLKEVSCRVALLKLHRRGVIPLPPAATRPPAGPQPGRAEAAMEEPPSIRCSLADLGPVELVPIGSAESQASRLWNGLMNRYHYLGAGPLCGAQIRYLIRSPRYGWLGGLAFSAAAWRLAARDRWIGWAEPARRQHLGQVVCNSRFLIRPQVRVPHLASHVLAGCLKRLGRDWQARYGVAPVLVETFVERARFKGTSYRAANWTCVGRTRGRGRQDGAHRAAGTSKDVYLFALQPEAHAILCEGPPPSRVPRRAPVDWAAEELGEAQLGDARLAKRLVTLARDFYARPQANIPQACQSRAKTKAAYRFLEHDHTTLEKILAPHYAATVRRVAQEPVVLAVQDTTTLNYSTHPATEQLGPIGSRKEGLVGLLLHDTLAFTPEGTPLGLLDVQCWARDPQAFGKRHRRYELPIEQKESQKWLTSFQKVAEVQRGCPATLLVSVGDREADIYELFALAAGRGAGPQLLVRAERDRLLAEGHEHVWARVAAQPLGGVQELAIPRRGPQPARVARLELRYAQVRLQPPKRKRQLPEVTLWAVLAEEGGAPPGVEPLRWMLLTTLEVRTFEDATRSLAWYTRRWGIEVYHRTLKSGCRIEQRQLGSADRLEACLAIDLVVAWRIFHLTKLGRETPEVPCTVFFEEAEWKALVAYVTHDPLPPPQAPTLREATRMVASLGGFLGRKGDGDPGTQTLWLGLQRLDDITATWKLMAVNFAPHLLIPPVSSNPGYG
jgi:hypothetical protein